MRMMILRVAGFWLLLSFSLCGSRLTDKPDDDDPGDDLLQCRLSAALAGLTVDAAIRVYLSLPAVFHACMAFDVIPLTARGMQ